MSLCQYEAEDEDRDLFEESEDEVEGMYAVDEGMPIEFEVESRGEIEGAGMKTGDGTTRGTGSTG
jgi:hypothetical protein